MAAEFEIDGTKFRVQRLELEAAFAGLEIVTQIAGPAFQQLALSPAQRNPEAIAKALAGGLGKVPRLIALFESVTEVTLPGTKTWARLELVKGQIFEGRHDVAIIFCTQCIEAEYGDFLSEGLQRAVDACKTLFESLAERTPGSGG